MQYIGDIKSGTLIGSDKLGNKYYENLDEVFGRHRWVEYASDSPDPSQITPEWHSWVHHVVESPPTVEKLVEPKFAIPYTENPTGTRKAFKTYNTVKAKTETWEPTVISRQ